MGSGNQYALMNNQAQTAGNMIPSRKKAGSNYPPTSKQMSYTNSLSG